MKGGEAVSEPLPREAPLIAFAHRKPQRPYGYSLSYSLLLNSFLSTHCVPSTVRVLKAKVLYFSFKTFFFVTAHDA